MRQVNHQDRPSFSERAGGFTLIELLVVVAIIAILAALLLPSSAAAKLKAQNIRCLSNYKQLTLAFRMYADDSKGNYPANEEGNYTTIDTGNNPSVTLPWVNGWEDYAGGTVGSDGQGSDTDVNYLTSGTYASMGPYAVNPQIFHCPADMSCQYGVRGLSRVRSVSMNQAIGCPIEAGTDTIGTWLGGQNTGVGNWKTYAKDSDVIRPSPSGLWLFLDEHPDSINDGAFAVMAAGVSDTSATWVDHPSALHGGACVFSFLDGHAVIHRWLEPNWKKDLRNPALYQNTSNSGPAFGQTVEPTGSGNPLEYTTDLRWMTEHTSAHLDGTPLGFTQVPD